MASSPPHRLSWLLLALMLGVIAVGGPGCTRDQEDSEFISLNGTWEVRAGFDPAWLTDSASTGWSKVELPHLFPPDSGKERSERRLTLRYRLPPKALELLSANMPLAIHLGRLSDVSTVYIQGQRVAQLGSDMPYRSAFYKHLVADLPRQVELPEGPAYLAIQLYTKGIYPLHVEGPELLLGPSSAIHQHWYRGETLTLVLLSLYALVGIHHIILYIRRPKEAYNLYFGLFCLLISAFWLFRTGLREEIFGDFVLLRKRIEYSLIFAAGGPLMLFVASLLNMQARWIRYLIVFTTCLVGLTLTGSYSVMRLCLTLWQLIVPFVFAYLVYLTARQSARGDRWARNLLVGFILLFLGLLLDIAGSRGLLPYQRGVATMVFPVFILGVADLLARRYAEVYQQAEELNLKLEQRVEARTHALAAALEAAESSNRAKSTFLAQLSHEIRTPMHGILGATELLLDSPLNADQQKLADTIRGTGQGFLRLLNDALDMARMGAGGISIKPTRVSLLPWLDSIGELFNAIARRKGLTLTVQVAPDVPEMLLLDPVRLRQVLSNLLGNAVRFTMHGGVSVRLRALRHTGTQVVLRFEVEDTGPGIPQSFQPQLFEPFAQADSSLSRTFGGTGLGTTIAKHIVEEMGGEIGFRSPVYTPPLSFGPGTLFWIELPLEVCVQATPSHAEDDLAQASQHQASQHQASQHQASQDPASQDPASPLDPADPPVPQAAPADNAENLADVPPAPESTDIPHLPFTSAGISGMVDPQEVTQHDMKVLSPPQPAPAAEAAARDMTVQDGQPSTPAAMASAPPAKLSVLVVEDNAVNQMILQRQLGALGTRVTLAVDGLKALQAVQEHTFHIILMDVQMPVMDGLESSRRMRSELSVTCPIIALTANAFPEDRARCLEAGMNEVLAKPCTRDELKKLLEHWTSFPPKS